MKLRLQESGALCKFPEIPGPDFVIRHAAASQRLKTGKPGGLMCKSESNYAAVKRLLIRQKSNLQNFSSGHMLVKQPAVSDFLRYARVSVSLFVSPELISAGKNNPKLYEKPLSLSNSILQNRHFSSPESGFANKVPKK